MQNSPLFYDAKTYALHNYWIMSNKKLEETDWQVALPKERSQFKAFNCSFSSTSYVAWHLSCIAFKWDMTMASAPNRLWKISSSNTWNSSFISCDVNTLFWYLIAVQFFPSLFFFSVNLRGGIQLKYDEYRYCQEFISLSINSNE